MLFIVKLTYRKPMKEINAHLEAHKEWLTDFMKINQFLLAGPLQDQSGGIILASCENPEELDEMLKKDSFYINQLVDIAVEAFHPLLRSDHFPEIFAINSKVIVSTRPSESRISKYLPL